MAVTFVVFQLSGRMPSSNDFLNIFPMEMLYTDWSLSRFLGVFYRDPMICFQGFYIYFEIFASFISMSIRRES